MNCKQGDLAIIVKSYAGNEGKIVRCVKFIGKRIFDKTDLFHDVWEIDQKLKGVNGTYTNEISDHQLRPIRDSDKEDEMLSILKIKEKVNV